NVGRAGDHDYRDERFFRVVRQALADCLGHAEAFRGAEEDGVAVRGCARGDFGTDHAASPRSILDDHLLAKTLTEEVRNEPPKCVGRAAWRERHDHVHGTLRVGLVSVEGWN